MLVLSTAHHWQLQLIQPQAESQAQINNLGARELESHWRLPGDDIGIQSETLAIDGPTEPQRPRPRRETRRPGWWKDFIIHETQPRKPRKPQTVQVPSTADDDVGVDSESADCNEHPSNCLPCAENSEYVPEIPLDGMTEQDEAGSDSIESNTDESYNGAEVLVSDVSAYGTFHVYWDNKQK